MRPAAIRATLAGCPGAPVPRRPRGRSPCLRAARRAGTGVPVQPHAAPAVPFRRSQPDSSGGVVSRRAGRGTMVEAMTDRLKVKARFHRLVGAVTMLVATRLARRAAQEEDGRPDSRNIPEQGKRDRAQDQDRAGRAATLLVAAARPIVQRAMSDPELRSALQQAFDTGREVTTEVRGKPAKKSARAHRARQEAPREGRDVGGRAAEGREGRRCKEPEPKKGFFRRVVTPLLVVGGVAAAVFTFMKKRGGGIGPTSRPTRRHGGGRRWRRLPRLPGDGAGR